MVTVVGIRGSVKNVRPIMKGFSQLGDEYILADSVNDPRVKTADLFLQTNLLKPKFATPDGNGPYEYIIKSQKPFLVQEKGIFHVCHGERLEDELKPNERYCPLNHDLHK